MKTTAHIFSHLRRRSFVISSGILLVLIFSLSLIGQTRISAQLVSWKLVPQPERYTELYFDRHLTLPISVSSAPIKFAFSIHNQEGSATTYPYAVVLDTPDVPRQHLATGVTKLADGDIVSVREAITLPKDTSSAVITVLLPNQQEEIHFRIGAHS